MRKFIFDNADHIKKALKRAIADRFYLDIEKLNKRRERRGRGPLDIFDYPLVTSMAYQKNLTLGDYVDNMVLPRSRRRVHIDQDEAMNIRTNFEHADTNSGRLMHQLIVVEWRNLGATDLTIDEIETRFRTGADFARQAYDRKTRIRANEQTAEGRNYSRALAKAIRSLGGRPRDADLVSQVRDLLDSAVTGEFPSLREPVTRGVVTTNLLADTVLALHAFDRTGDFEAGPLRQAIEALNSQVIRTVPSTSPAYASAFGFINKAGGLINELQYREMNHLQLNFLTGQSLLWPDQRSTLALFAQHVARQAAAYVNRRPGLVVRVYGPGIGVNGPLSWLSSKAGNNPGTNVASLLRPLVYQELRKAGIRREVVAFETQERSIDSSGPQPVNWRPVWVSLEPAPIPDPERGRDGHSHGSHHGHSRGHRSASADGPRPGGH